MRWNNNPPDAAAKENVAELYDYVFKLNEKLNVILPNLETDKQESIEERLSELEKRGGIK